MPSPSPDETATEGPVKPSFYCGWCAGHGEVWCPDCMGFTGCQTCAQKTRVPCPECNGNRSS